MNKVERENKVLKLKLYLSNRRLSVCVDVLKKHSDMTATDGSYRRWLTDAHDAIRFGDKNV